MNGSYIVRSLVHQKYIMFWIRQKITFNRKTTPLTFLLPMMVYLLDVTINDNDKLLW